MLAAQLGGALQRRGLGIEQRNLRDQGAVLDDPEVSEYIQSIGSRLAAQVGEEGQNFQFFVVKDPRINAFALPGGFIVTPRLAQALKMIPGVARVEET